MGDAAVAKEAVRVDRDEGALSLLAPEVTETTRPIIVSRSAVAAED